MHVVSLIPAGQPAFVAPLAQLATVEIGRSSVQGTLVMVEPDGMAWIEVFGQMLHGALVGRPAPDEARFVAPEFASSGAVSL